jgi:hypothetical protein
MGKLGYRKVNDIVSSEYRKAGYKGNLGNDYIWVRDAVSAFLLRPNLVGKHSGNWKTIYKSR